MTEETNNKNKKIRYGVIGLGHIAQAAVLPAFQHAKKNSELTALITGDRAKGEKLAKAYKLASEQVFSYSEFRSVLDSGDIDALYVCLPNADHFDCTCTALRSGVHVLCEKPLALSLREGMEMWNCARRSRRLLMTAYRLHFEPANLKAVELCRSGELGELKYFSSDFSFVLPEEAKGNIRTRFDEGGGALWDIGIYCINAARHLFGEEPTEAFAYAGRGRPELFRDVEESASVILKFSGDRNATFNCSFGADTASRFSLVGSEGSVHVENAYEYTGPRTLILQKDEKKTTSRFKNSDQFAPEIVYFSEAIQTMSQPLPDAIEGMRDIAVIEAILESIDRGYPIPVRLVGGEDRQPSVDLRMTFPPVSQPTMVS